MLSYYILQFVDYLSKSSLVIDVWGKQSDDGNKNKKASVSTKQLMNQDQLVRGRTSTMVRGDDEERYKMLCEINTQKRRAQRNAQKLVSSFLQQLVNKLGWSLKLQKILKMLFFLEPYQ